MCLEQIYCLTIKRIESRVYMRTKNSLKNISASLANNLLLNILRFVSRTLFIKYLGETYLGVNGMLSNVLGILAFADLGIGSAISYSLYKPLSLNDKKKIQSLMKFYKTAYYIIAGVVLVLGLGLLPFLSFFVKDSSSVPSLNIYYLIFLFNMAIGYVFSYKRTLIIADQHEYEITPLVMLSNFLLTFFQILVIILFKNYILYLIVQSLSIIFENIVVNHRINKKYDYINDKNIEKLTKEELKPIKTNIKALMYHKVGSYFVDSTDNILISKYLGLSIVGFYSNYYLIINMLNTFINSALYSIISSVGNLNVSEKPKKRLEVFKTLNFLSFVVFSTCSLCLYNLFNLFIGDIWLGKKFLLSTGSVLIICIVFYVNGLMHTNEAVKSSAGLYDKDKYVPIIQSIINIVFSILLVKSFGLAGIFIGTLISALFVMVVKPIIIYKYLFESKVWSYYIEFIKEFIILILAGVISNYIVSLDFIGNAYVAFIIYGIITVVVLYALIFLLYRNKPEFKDVVNRIKFMKEKRKNKNA